MNYNMGLQATQNAGRFPTRRQGITRERCPSMMTKTILNHRLFIKKIVIQNPGFLLAKKMLKAIVLQASKTNQTTRPATIARSLKRGKPMCEHSKLDKSIATESDLTKVKLKNKAEINRTVF